ncbi:Zinc finger and SCAN domain-containing protein 29 [Chelonia mydas]|uniref:Zinc finger and SCAN domain-containing protein 29 n=1 Tax=Chelonia mydas TaxID=8469 RepID=M7BLG7_CHEMY|nr:Zinc finger and SCAN domain-containing protein 29 [Chelonia mydas]
MQWSQRIFPGGHACSCTRRSPAWTNAELLIRVWGEEAVQSQLCSSHRNYDTYGQMSRCMTERGHDRDTPQCRVKMKEWQNTYHKAREANRRSGAAPTTCRFYKEVDAILGGDSTFTVKAPVDTSVAHMPVQSGLSQEEEILDEDVEGDPKAEDDSKVRDACSQELFSTPEEANQSQLSDVGEAQTGEESPAIVAGAPQTPPTHSCQPPGSSLYLRHSTSPPSQSGTVDSHYPLHSSIPLQFSPAEVQYPLHCIPKKKVGYDPWTYLNL